MLNLSPSFQGRIGDCSVIHSDQRSLTFLGFEFGWAWPCLNGGYWLFGGLITPDAEGDRDNTED